MMNPVVVCLEGESSKTAVEKFGQKVLRSRPAA
jgi:hypothetical protein